MSETGHPAPTLQEMIAKLRDLESWNHEQFVDKHADGASFYEHEHYERGAQLYEEAEQHRIASVGIEQALAAQALASPSPAAVQGEREEPRDGGCTCGACPIHD